MRSIAAGALVTLLAGCPSRETRDCGNGFLCPVGTACAAPGHCGDPTLVSLCVDEGKHEYDSCQAATFSGTCRDGVCTACTPDLAGCGQATWQAMTSPATGRLNTVWAVPPATGMPVTLAFAGGDGGVFLQYDGRQWARATNAPPTMAAIVSVWASGADDVYATTATASDIFHFDGTAWRNIRADLPTSAAISAIAGTAKTDVYAVGFSGTVLHFDGAMWTQISSAGPQFTGVVKTANGPLAVGAAGYIWEPPGPPMQLLPMAVKTQDLKSVSLHNGNPVTVGLATATTSTICERVAGTWMADSADTMVDLFTVWNDFAGGASGKILHASGATWALMDTPGGGNVLGISGGGGDVFAVGEGGLIWRYFEQP